MKRLLILAGIGAAFALAACVYTPEHRYGQACDRYGQNCTPVVCDSADQCAAAPYAYRDDGGAYVVSDRNYYGPNYDRPVKVCDRYGRGCYWVNRSSDGRYYDRSGTYIGIGVSP